VNCTEFEEETVRLYLDFVHNIKQSHEEIEYTQLIELVKFLIDMGKTAKGTAKESQFEINLLHHCLDLLNNIEMASDVRYQTSLIFASLQNEEITSFLTKFLTQISREEFMRLNYMAIIDIVKTEEFLKSNIKTDGLGNLFRDFLIPKNLEFVQMFQMEIENPLDKAVSPLFDFKMIELKFKKTFYEYHVSYQCTDRVKMKIEELDINNESWMDNHLKMENGLVEFTIPKTGKYHFVQQSRSSNLDDRERIGPAMGVNVELEIDLKRGEKLYVFIADTIFLFNQNMKLISVPGSAGSWGNHLSNGSLTTELEHSDQFEVETASLGYDYQSVLNGTNRKYCDTGSGYKAGTKRYPGSQGGSTFVQPQYKSTIKQNEEIPSKYDNAIPYSGFTVPFIQIKLL
jgi:hypothetical protein